MFNHLQEVHMRVLNHGAAIPTAAKSSIMKGALVGLTIACSVLVAGPAQAQSEVSGFSDPSGLPLASVLIGGTATGASLVAPVVLSAAGALFVVKAVEVGALSTVYVLERASDGARVSL
jgi:hypothetical protein